MNNIESFKNWLDLNTEYTKPTKSNIVSRLNRANKILAISKEPVYLFYLSQTSEFQKLTVSVKSQVRRAVKIYYYYMEVEGADKNDNKIGD